MGGFTCREGFSDCFPYRIGETEGVGRQLLTTRDVKMGQVLYVEDPLVVGPSQECDPICLTCLAAIDTSYLCTKCGYPMCDAECATDPVHTRECSVLARARLTDQLMDHKEERKGLDYWEFSRKTIVPFIQESCEQGQWSEDEIQRAVGI